MRVIKRIKAVGLGLMLGVSVIGTSIPVKAYVSERRYEIKDKQGRPKPLWEVNTKMPKKYICQPPKKGIVFTGKDKKKKQAAWDRYMKGELDRVNVSFGDIDFRYLNMYKGQHLDKYLFEDDMDKYNAQLPVVNGIYVVDFLKPLKNARCVVDGMGVSVTRKEYQEVGEQLEALGFQVISKKDFESRLWLSDAEEREPQKYNWVSKAYLYQTDKRTRILVYLDVSVDKSGVWYNEFTKKKVREWLADGFGDYARWEKDPPYRLHVIDCSMGKDDERYDILKKTLKITHRWWIDTEKYKAFQYPDGESMLRSVVYSIHFKTPMRTSGYRSKVVEKTSVKGFRF